MEDKAEAAPTPLIIRIIAGFNCFIFLLITFSLLKLLLNPILISLIIDPTLLIVVDAIVNPVLALFGLPLTTLLTYPVILGFSYICIGVVGIVITVMIIYRRSQALLLGSIICTISISGSIISYILIASFLFNPLEEIFVLFRALVNGFLPLVFLSIPLFLWYFNEYSNTIAPLHRFIFIWNLDAVSLLWTIWIIPGLVVFTVDTVVLFGIVYTIVAIISVINLLFRPLITRLIIQTARWALGFSITFILIVLLNSAIIRLVPLITPGFIVLGLPMAFLASLCFTAINALYIGIIDLDDSTSFFQNRVYHHLFTKASHRGVSQTPGLLCIQIDGLSYPALQEAIQRGYMPTVKSLIDSGNYKAIQWDCGLPSTTPCCLAGIMHGHNNDIPGFCWYRKKEDRLLVFNRPRDAGDIEKDQTTGKGLIRGGTSVGNVFSGDAAYSFFTMAKLTKQDAQTSKHRREDLYYYLLHPYALMRTIVLTFWDVIMACTHLVKWWIFHRKPRMVQPRRNYIFYRPGTNILLRDIVTNIVSLNISRGSPAIYATYYGYDEIAHYAGTFSTTAFRALSGIDKQVRRLLYVIRKYAPRPYEFFMLADHGQSFGLTFRQRYRHSLQDTIFNLLGGKARVSEIDSHELPDTFVGGLIADFKESNYNVTIPHQGDIEGEKTVDHSEMSQLTDDVIVCPSGNLAHIYFTHKVGRVTLEELEAKYPGFLTRLVAHEGIGFVIVTDADDGPVLLGEEGAVILRTGLVRGANPLTAYGKEDLRIQQLQRLAEFPSSGDLILNSQIYSDGTVAAFEELVGSHGGLGGLQTAPFLLHPAEIEVDRARLVDSDQLYPLLNQRRAP
ncbi:MAG: alkaline phosphatase family protein [Candidatus Hodarchaeota archaeon]